MYDYFDSNVVNGNKTDYFIISFEYYKHCSKPASVQNLQTTKYVQIYTTFQLWSLLQEEMIKYHDYVMKAAQPCA